MMSCNHLQKQRTGDRNASTEQQRQQQQFNLQVRHNLQNPKSKSDACAEQVQHPVSLMLASIGVKPIGVFVQMCLHP